MAETAGGWFPVSAGGCAARCAGPAPHRHRLGEGVRRSALDTRERESETVFSTKRIAERLKHALADTKAFLKRLLHLRVRESRTMPHGSWSSGTRHIKTIYNYTSDS
jgi:hypothetical protein